MLSILFMLVLGTTDIGDACLDIPKAVEIATPLVERFEGLARCVGPIEDRCSLLTAYPDPGVGYALPTIGWGTTSLSVSKADIYMGMHITRLDANVLLTNELGAVAKQVCSQLSTPVSTQELAALLSFTYNLGVGTLIKSSKKGLLFNINSGRKDLAAKSMRRYIYAAGRKLPGLVRRRDVEARVFEGKNER